MAASAMVTPRPADRGDELSRREGRRLLGLVVSAVLHAIVLVVLALSIKAARRLGDGEGLTILPDAPVRLDAKMAESSPIKPADANPQIGEAFTMPIKALEPKVGPINPISRDSASTPVRVVRPDGVGAGQVESVGKFGPPGGLGGRGQESRAELARIGSTPDGEAAVERGLRWLAAQQQEDGGWTFFHREGSTRSRYLNPGTEPSTTAATALALLPFLGAGYTHRGDHQYAETVRQGLYYLNNRATSTGDGIDLREGTMYAQGLATIALCEAYAMTGDPDLRDIAQGSVDFIVFAQDKTGGGWRYQPGEPGDTTVTGWQWMALKSAEMAKLNVPTPTLIQAGRFLDSVEVEYGSQYGYMTPEPRPATTAIGLLCRMYGGWRRDSSALIRGVEVLGQWGPSKTNLYYDYYATQVLHHCGGKEWYKWNAAMRDYLVATQSNAGLENGSWYFPDRHGDKGGRLYNTAMAVMILEVYYRHLPLYKPKATE